MNGYPQIVIGLLCWILADVQALSHAESASREVMHSVWTVVGSMGILIGGLRMMRKP